MNKYAVSSEHEIAVLVVDNAAVREKQLARLAEVRARRNGKEVEAALNALTRCAESGEGNLLELAVNAARKRATLGEISSALEKVFGLYQAVQHTISGVYSAESRQDRAFVKARKLTDDFAKSEGRRPRILVAKMGQDGHDRGAKVIATAFADLGFDVDLGPLFQTPEEVARMAVENDVHVLGVSTLAGGHMTLVPEVIQELKRLGRQDILVVVGGVVPPPELRVVSVIASARPAPASDAAERLVTTRSLPMVMYTLYTLLLSMVSASASSPSAFASTKYVPEAVPTGMVIDPVPVSLVKGAMAPTVRVPTRTSLASSELFVER